MGMRFLLHSSPAPVAPAPYGLYSLHQNNNKDRLSTEELARRQRVLGKFPTLQGKHDFASFQEKDKKLFKKYHDYGDSRALAPYRDDNPSTDTVSHFPAPSADAGQGNFSGYSPLINKAQEARPGSTVPKEAEITIGNDKKKEIDKRLRPWSTHKEELHEDVERSSTEKEDNQYPIDILNDKELRDKLATRAFYKTTTQKLYEGVDWHGHMKATPQTKQIGYQQRPDLVSRRVKRYNDKAEPWQEFVKRPFSWDYLQRREEKVYSSPLSFTSENKKGHQIPDYAGNICGEGEKDTTGTPFLPFTTVRSYKPRITDTGRRGYIPGYQGCTHWTNPNPPYNSEKEPRAESTARVHRPFSYPLNRSPHKHESPLSKLVSLSHPFNPNNSTAPRNCDTASGLRV